MTTTTNDTDTNTEAEAEIVTECNCYSVWDQGMEAHVSCGGSPSRKREFLPGHDAKYKSVLIKAFRDETDFVFIDGGMRIEADPMELAKERGWEKFLTPKPARKSRAKAEKADAKDNAPSGAEKADDDGSASLAGFQPARFRVGRWDKDGSVVSHNDDGTITVAYTDKKGKTKQLTLEAEKVELG